MLPNDSGGAGREYVELKVDQAGRLLVLAGSNNHGQGHETVLIQQISADLGFPPDRIDVIESDTRVVRRGEGTGGSGSAAFNAAAAQEAIRQCIAQGVPVAARLLQADPANISFSEGEYGMAESGRRVSFAEVALASVADESMPIQAMGEAILESAAFPNGCQIAEVEIDPATGTMALVAYTVCDDVGFELNPMLVRGQLMGGIAQGAGQALMENLMIDASGQVRTGSFMDYAIPRATDLPRMTVLSHLVSTATNPLGIKGVGESGTVGSLPAVMNAVNNALAAAGAKPIDMPATPARIWRALQEAVV